MIVLRCIYETRLNENVCFLCRTLQLLRHMIWNRRTLPQRKVLWKIIPLTEHYIPLSLMHFSWIISWNVISTERM